MGRRDEILLKYNARRTEKSVCEIWNYKVIKGMAMVDEAVLAL